MKMHGFTAEALLNRSGVHYQNSAVLNGPHQRGEELVHPAIMFACGLKECCLEFAGTAFCCHRSDDYCYHFDL